MKNSLIIIGLMVLCMPFHAYTQDCLQKLEDAKRQYYSGQFNQIESTLSACLEDLSTNDKVEALRLLTNAHLLLDNQELADEYMGRLLKVNPEFVPSSVDLQEFTRLYEDYDLNPNYSLGVSIGLNIPQFEILQHVSTGTNAAEPMSYEDKIGLRLGLMGNYFIRPNISVGSGLQLSQLRYSTTESIMGYRSISSSETFNFITLPLTINYEISFKQLYLIAGVGTDLSWLLKSGIDINHFSPESDNPWGGSTFLLENYNITFQRKKFTQFYTGNIGIYYQLTGYVAGINYTYGYGSTKLNNPDQRYTDLNLVKNYAYVPDDFKSDFHSVMVSVSKRFIKPKRK